MADNRLHGIRAKERSLSVSQSVMSVTGETQTVMRVSVTLAHPDKARFNQTIASVVHEQLERNGHGLLFQDLCAENFEPHLVCEDIPKEALLPEQITSHCEELRQADGIVTIHPNWWGQPPAILKGWIDRVIRPGIDCEGIPKTLLRNEAAVVFGLCGVGNFITAHSARS